MSKGGALRVLEDLVQGGCDLHLTCAVCGESGTVSLVSALWRFMTIHLGRHSEATFTGEAREAGKLRAYLAFHARGYLFPGAKCSQV